MGMLVLVIVTASLAVFVLGCAIRAVGYASQPLHLRWELYPVPHEERRRVRHGGSYFEEMGGREKPRQPNRLGELQAMLAEILFMRGLWEFNRPLWLRSYPFHLGLYLLAGTVCLVVVTALLALHGPALPAGVPRVLHGLMTLTGLAGLVLAGLGATALLARRLSDAALQPYTIAADVVHLAWFIVALGAVLAGALTRGPQHAGAVAFAQAVLTFAPPPPVPALLAAGLILSALLLVYIPFSHMSHFIGKYFLYHAIRWDDRAHLPGDRMGATLAEYLAYRPTWAARHVGADGGKSWAEVVASNPAQEAKR